MSTTAPAKRIRLVSNKITQTNGHLGKQRKTITWVDVGDDEDTQRKMPHINGTPNGHYGRGKNARRKQARSSWSVEGTTINGSGAGSSNAAQLQEQRKQLPIAQGACLLFPVLLVIQSFGVGRDALIQEIRNNDVTVLLGETGSGKTTRV